MADDRASFIAFLIAPMVPAIAFALTSPGLGGGSDADIATLAGLFVLGYFFAFFAVGLLGLPAFLILRRWHYHGLAASTVSGAVLGFIVAFVLAPRPLYLSIMAWIWEMKGLAVVGATTGSAFWAARMLCLKINDEKTEWQNHPGRESSTK